jgi:hypothetical protein
MVDVISINWVNDDVGVAVLGDELEIHCSNMFIPVKSINKKLSAQNRARKNPLDLERVDAIRCAFDKQLPMPKIMVRKVSESEYVIIGGNHRFNGLPPGVLSIPVHVYECTDAEFEIAVVLANTYVGDGVTKAYRIEKAVDAYQRLGMSQKRAAKAFSVTQQAVQDAVKHKTVMAKLHSLPQRVQQAMTFSHVKAIGDLSKNDNVLRAASIAVANSKATVKETTELAQEARAHTTEEAQVAVFTKYTRLNGVESDVSKPIPRRIRNSFTKACQSIKALKENKTWQSLEFSADQIKEAKALAMEVIDILSCLCLVDG